MATIRLKAGRGPGGLWGPGGGWGGNGGIAISSSGRAIEEQVIEVFLADLCFSTHIWPVFRPNSQHEVIYRYIIWQNVVNGA